MAGVPIPGVRGLSTSACALGADSSPSKAGLQLVYTGGINKLIKRVKIFSLLTSAVGASLQPWLFTTASGPLIVKAAMFTTLTFFVVVTPLALNMVTKRYVTRLYYDQSHDRFEAVSLSLLARERTVTFSSDDIDVPDVTGPFTSLLIKNRPYFVDFNSVSNDAAELRLRGLHKPLKID